MGRHAVDLALGSIIEVPTDLSDAPVYLFEPMLIMAKPYLLAARANSASPGRVALTA